MLQEEDCEQSLEQFTTQFGSSPTNSNPARSELNVVVTHLTEEHSLGIFFPDSTKIGISEVRVRRALSLARSLARLLRVVPGLTETIGEKATPSSRSANHRRSVLLLQLLMLPPARRP